MSKSKRFLISLSPGVNAALQALMKRDLQSNQSEEVRSLIVKEYNAYAGIKNAPVSSRPVGRPKKHDDDDEYVEEIHGPNAPATIPDPLNPGQFINYFEQERRKAEAAYKANQR